MVGLRDAARRGPPPCELVAKCPLLHPSVFQALSDLDLERGDVMAGAILHIEFTNGEMYELGVPRGWRPTTKQLRKDWIELPRCDDERAAITLRLNQPGRYVQYVSVVDEG